MAGRKFENSLKERRLAESCLRSACRRLRIVLPVVEGEGREQAAEVANDLIEINVIPPAEVQPVARQRLATTCEHCKDREWELEQGQAQVPGICDHGIRDEIIEVPVVGASGNSGVLPRVEMDNQGPRKSPPDKEATANREVVGGEG